MDLEPGKHPVRTASDIYRLWLIVYELQAKILRMGYDALGAIKVLEEGLSPERPHTFVQADALVGLPPLARLVFISSRPVCGSV